MKKLACGDLMKGCAHTFEGATEEAILALAGKHAVQDHGMEVTPELVEQVRAHIRREEATS
jgi:predicted small metal-binding protein